jgi:hypothetical protein
MTADTASISRLLLPSSRSPDGDMRATLKLVRAEELADS